MEENIYYRASVEVLLNGEFVEVKENVGFRVLGEEAPAPQLISHNEGSEESSANIMVGLLIIIVIIIIGLLVFYLIRKK